MHRFCRLSRPTPHHACTPTAPPSGVLRHRDDPFAVPPPRSLRPCPHRCCQSHDSSACCSLWLCTRPTARTALQVCVWRRPSNGPCASRTAQLHARMRQRRMLPELPRDGRRSSVRASAGWEGVGGRVAGVRDPEARDLGRSGPRTSGFPPVSSSTRARARGALLLCRMPA